MEEICQNCGSPKFTHPDIEMFFEQGITDSMYDVMLQEIVRCTTLYDNVCINYKRDNLKYLESLVK
jgi:hypothetical protein